MEKVEERASPPKSDNDRLNRALKLALAANHALLQSTSEIEFFQNVCNIAVEIGGYRMAWIGYVEDDEAKTIRPVAHAGHETGYLATAKITWEDNERGRGPSGVAVRTGQFAISRNISTDPMFHVWRDDALKRGFNSSIALPLRVEGRIIGQIAIYSSELDAFDSQEVEILKGLADDLGIGISLVRAEDLFRSIFENAPLGLVRFDSKWRFLSVNAAYAQMVGYSESELLNMTIMDVTHPDDRKITVTNRARAEGPNVLKGFEKRYITKSGKLMWARISGKQFKIKGEPQWLATVEDVTERRELEEKLELERRKSLQSAKLASLGEMSAAIAHEINNPITVILASLGLLEKMRLEPEKFSKGLDRIRKAGEKVSQIASGLTKFSRRSEFSKKSPQILSEIAKDAEEIVALTSAKFGVSIEMDLQTDAKVLGNEIEVAQAVQNLLTNALDAVKQSTEKWVHVTVFENEAQVVVRVTDSGPGVIPGTEEKIFEPFFTTKPVGSGTGLGLSIVKGIMTDHEGSVELLKVDGHTCFELRFAKI